MDWTLIFRNPSPSAAPTSIPATLLENPPVSGRILYEMACQVYRSQEDSLRMLQKRASDLLNVSLLVLTGGVVTFLNLSRTFWLGTSASLFCLICACVVLLWALRPIPFSEHFSPRCVMELPPMVQSDDRFFLWLALSYDPLIQSVHRALQTIALRVFLASVLLILGLALFAVTLILR